jgi:hypothetical protein
MSQTEEELEGDGLEEPALSGALWHYKPWLTAEGPALVRLVEEVFQAIPAPSVTPGRRPRKDAAERRKLCVGSLIANLVVSALSPTGYEGTLVSTNRAGQNRYNRAPFTTQVLSQCVPALGFTGIIQIERGTAQRRCTRLRPSAGFLELLARHGVTLADVGKASSAETLLLRGRGARGTVGDLLDYQEDGLTAAMRQELEDLNAGLNAADIRFEGEPVGPIHMVRIFLDDAAAPAWSKHGRLYRGHAWQELSKSRRHLLTIDGEALCDLDWSSCLTRIAYAKAGAVPPEGDLYAIPGLESCRDTVKVLLSALFFRRPPAPGKEPVPFTPKLPRGTRQQLPEGWNGKRFLAAASRLHPLIAHLFGRPDVGFELMKTEADMMLEVLKRLRLEGCIALPCHDGLLCKRTHQTIAVEAMRAVSREVLGFEIPVTEKALWRPEGK